MTPSTNTSQDKETGLWTAWLIRTLAGQVRPGLGRVVYRPATARPIPSHPIPSHQGPSRGQSRPSQARLDFETASATLPWDQWLRYLDDRRGSAPSP